MPFGQDGSASIDGVRERYERELGNDLGNLLSRTTAMIARYRDGALEPRSGGARRSPRLPRAAARRRRRALDRFDITGALEAIWDVVRAPQPATSSEQQPWQLAKDEARAAELDAVLYDLVDGLRAVAVALAAVPPETASRDPRRARPAADDLAWENVAYGLTARPTGSAGGSRCSRASTSRAAAA